MRAGDLGVAMSKDDIRQVGLITYVLYGIAAVFPPAAIAGVIYAYIKRDDVAGSFAESHMTWLIRTFWLTLAFGVVGMVLALVLVGFLVLFAVGVWYIFRVVKGFVLFYEATAIRDAQAMF
jgi:uncharacterized membrane protein